VGLPCSDFSTAILILQENILYEELQWLLFDKKGLAVTEKQDLLFPKL